MNLKILDPPISISPSWPHHTKKCIIDAFFGVKKYSVLYALARLLERLLFLGCIHPVSTGVEPL
ncbi:hypothetical protein [Nostoc sp.]|uniref:hypothetical protein n=1 Tax=Nostoc sp. TaxID=1180 RepID=UPI002FFA4790